MVDFGVMAGLPFPKKVSGSGMLQFPGGDHSWKGPSLLFPCGSGKTQQRRGPGHTRAVFWAVQMVNILQDDPWDPRLKMDGAPALGWLMCCTLYRINLDIRDKRCLWPT